MVDTETGKRRRAWLLIGSGILLLTLLLAITEQTWGLFVITAVLVAVMAWRTRPPPRAGSKPDGTTVQRQKGRIR